MSSAIMSNHRFLGRPLGLSPFPRPFSWCVEYESISLTTPICSNVSIHGRIIFSFRKCTDRHNLVSPRPPYTLGPMGGGRQLEESLNPCCVWRVGTPSLLPPPPFPFFKGLRKSTLTYPTTYTRK
uniref:Uncharacterized protein n=1 Tax=Cacopsylla melanoneura TaxID=428564 RepID=A0A8D8T108_9HEMI